jgi:hypothetical protein
MIFGNTSTQGLSGLEFGLIRNITSKRRRAPPAAEGIEAHQEFDALRNKPYIVPGIPPSGGAP